MAGDHSDVAAELWALAETVLSRLEPILRQTVDVSDADQQERPRQGCSWCPVCALAALVRGEQHELLALLASEGATILALIRQLVAEHSAASSPGANREPSTTHGDQGQPATERSGFERSGFDRSGFDHTDEATIAPDTDDPVVRRVKFVPITVTVKDSTTPTGEGRNDP